MIELKAPFINFEIKTDKIMKVALLQYSPYWEDKNRNKLKILSMLNDLPRFDALILPELSLTGFTMNSGKFCEPIFGETFRFFSELAKDFKCDVLGGLIEKDIDKIYNTIIHVDVSGELQAKYRKIHPFSYSNEDKNYNRGINSVITSIKDIQTGLSICYDLRFPELYRLYGKSRVDLIINIANWPDTRIEHWRTLLKARAIENQCYVVGVNRVGDDPKLHYNGFSSVFDPMGNEILSCKDEENIFFADIDKSFVANVREKFPFLNDIRLL